MTAAAPSPRRISAAAPAPTGQFALSRDWTFGWDGTISTDRTFTQNYNVLNDDTASTTSFAYLTGLRDRNYFDARVEYFEILADTPLRNTPTKQDRQAVILPVVDHDYIVDVPVLGGEVALRSNLVNLTREDTDPFEVNGETLLSRPCRRLFPGAREHRVADGNSSCPVGQLLTTFASARGDFYAMDPRTMAGSGRS